MEKKKASKQGIKKVRKISPFKLRRAVFHILLGTSIIFLSLFYSKAVFVLFYMLLAGIVLSLLSLRFKIPGIWFMIRHFEYYRYIKELPGKSALFFFAGCLLALKLFPQQIALASIAILTFGDPTTSLVSALSKRRYRKPFNTLKNFYGTIAGIIVSFFAALFFVPWKFAIVAAIAAMISEAFIIDIGSDTVDDNLVVPLVAGTVLYLLM